MEVSESKIRKTCPTHGEYDEVTIENPFKRFGEKLINLGCPACHKERIEREAAEQQREAELERQRIRRQNALKSAGIPKRFQSRTFENYQADSVGQQRAKRTAKQYADEFANALETGQSLIFTGKTGTGKTHLANAIANQVMQAGHSAAFMSVRELVGRVKETWNKRSEKTESEVIRELVKLDLLILDEVGVQFDSDAERLIMFDVINGRYEDVKPTVVLSNYPVDSTDGPSIRKVLGDRVIDRLREGGGKMIAFDWESFRKIGA